MADAFVKDKMMRDINYKELKRLKLTEKYVVTGMNEKPLTEKFYTKYTVEASVDSVKVDANVKLIDYNIGLGPREKYPEPVCESHCYGWYLKPLIPLDRNDTRFYHPHVYSDFVKIDSTDKQVQQPKFVGIPFKLR